MAAGQRPVTDTALSEASTAPAWKHVPSWFVYGDADRNIPRRPCASWRSGQARGRRWW
ncbi:hypothetical protein [Novosphingobium sp. 9]|uniref:hypothetical protein n=1 Tax=Novosphingobium sp. 9 TaxID=2025349 RepID=UPI0021B5B72A|nr:hypothetical protein [Novosphingobium sp. 9]